MIRVTQSSLFITNIDVPVIIGVFPHERTKPQIVRLSLKIIFQPDKDHHPSETDRVADTLDYEKVLLDILYVCGKETPSLLERLAGLIADRIFSRYADIRSISISIHKVPAPVGEGAAESVGIAISFAREEQNDL
ncbi:MAG: dihydroneopterin aldolase [Leptospirales bacterium]